MEVIFRAFDGKEFHNEVDCKIYEFKEKVLNKTDGLIFYDKNGNIIDDVTTEDAYNNCQTIVVKDKKALEALRELEEHNGYLSYVFIDFIGTWTWEGNGSDGKFVKKED